MSKEKKSLDILGVQPIADAIKTSLEGVGTFLGKICLPAAEEYGLLLKDRVSYWRAKNLAKIARKAEKIIGEQGGLNKRRAPPRLVHMIMETGSWSDTDDIQEMWAGLLVSSCTKEGRDDENLIFADLLSRLTVSEARMLNYVCSKSKKKLSSNKLIYAQELLIEPDLLMEITGVENVFRLDRELDHLRSLDLFGGGFSIPKHDDPDFRQQQEETKRKREELIAEGRTEHLETFKEVYTPVPDDTGLLLARVTPNPLALSLYVRVHGSQDPIEFFGFD